MGTTEHEQVIIVGSGFAGLGMAIKLQEAGIPFVVLERGDEVGGTWRDNHYPGAACDVQSHLYSFSFEPNPRWSRMFAPQAEIQQYLVRCADTYGLRPHIRFGSTATAARFDEREGLWTVETACGERVRGRALVSGCGALSRPSVPALPGLEHFRGERWHSAAWRHDVDLQDKRVAVIGTGASAIQFVPQVAKVAPEVRVFQRTPPWIIPKPDRAIRPWEQALFERIPAAQQLARLTTYWQLEPRAAAFTISPKIMKLAEVFAKAHLRRQVPSPALRAKLLPDYTIGCKRILISNDYYPSLTQPNVDLVTSGIRSIGERSITTADGVEHPCDVIVFGTGFRAAEEVAPFPTTGLAGRDLNDHWRGGGAEAFKGTSISGFPSFFMIPGPNTGLGHSSMVFMIEAQIAHVMKLLRLMRSRGLRYVDVRPEAQARYNAGLQRRLGRTVWASGCNSWYQTASGKNTTLWPGFTFEFRLRTARLDPRDYRQAPLRRTEPAASDPVAPAEAAGRAAGAPMRERT